MPRCGSLRKRARRRTKPVAAGALLASDAKSVLGDPKAAALNSSPVLCWWSAGVTSAVATKLAVMEFGERVRPVYFAIESAHADNARFKAECERWYGMPIETVRSAKYADQFDVIERTRYVNGPAGARCTLELKKKVRIEVEKAAPFDHQIFGFEYARREINRAIRFKEQYPHTRPIFPLIEKRMSKAEALHFLDKAGIKAPAMYALGYSNNNCIGCVKGGAGYWNKIREDFPDHFERMAALERKIGHSCLRGQYLHDLPIAKGRRPKPIAPDCGNFCDIEFADLEHPQLDLLLESPGLLRSV